MSTAISIILIASLAAIVWAVERRQATVIIEENSPYHEDEICCQASGDPHYLSFDGRRFDFMGEGTYLMAGNCCGSPRLSVYGHNVFRYGLNTVTYLDAVSIYIFGYTVRLGQRRSVQINGRTIPIRRLPFQTDTFRVYQFRNNFVCVNTIWGLRACFNGGSLTRICYPLASRHFRAFDGLCNVTSFTTPIDRPAGIDPDIPDLRDIPIQFPTVRTSVPCCDPIDVTRNDFCGLLIDATGPLRNCIQDRRLNSLNYYRDCQFDACSFRTNSTVAALLAREVVQNYVDMCQIVLNTDILI